jgi:hypothetical protein
VPLLRSQIQKITGFFFRYSAPKRDSTNLPKLQNSLDSLRVLRLAAWHLLIRRHRGLPWLRRGPGRRLGLGRRGRLRRAVRRGRRARIWCRFWCLSRVRLYRPPVFIYRNEDYTGVAGHELASTIRVYRYDRSPGRYISRGRCSYRRRAATRPCIITVAPGHRPRRDSHIRIPDKFG